MQDLSIGLSIVCPREPTQTPCGRLSFKRRLAAGAEGGVWLATPSRASSTSSSDDAGAPAAPPAPPTDANAVYAVKVLDGGHGGAGWERYTALRNSLKALKHPHIVAVRRLQWEASSSRTFITMELCDCDLQELIVRAPGSKLREGQASSYARQVLLALKHCHRQGLAHGDIKPENLLHMCNRDIVKLCDFGCMCVHGTGASPLSGSHSYMAPEGFLCGNTGTGFNPLHADMWSLGITVYTMVAGHVPWAQAARSDPEYSRWRGLPQGHPSRYPAHFSAQLRDLLDALLAATPTARRTAEQALEHPWVARLPLAQQPAPEALEPVPQRQEQPRQQQQQLRPVPLAPSHFDDAPWAFDCGRQAGACGSGSSPVARELKRLRRAM